MEPTDIDEIRIGTEKILYTAGDSELCEEYKDSSTESTMMTFYFEKACETNADCNNKCQECYQGRCKANYDLPGCGGDGDPEGTTCPTAPVCGECEIKVYDAKGCHVGCQTTSCCPAPECGPDDVFDEEKCTCLPSDCPTAPVCGECDIKVYDEDGCHIGCQTTSCCPAPDCGPDEVLDEEKCACVKRIPCDPP